MKIHVFSPAIMRPGVTPTDRRTEVRIHCNRTGRYTESMIQEHTVRFRVGVAHAMDRSEHGLLLHLRSAVKRGQLLEICFATAEARATSVLEVRWFRTTDTPGTYLVGCRRLFACFS